MNTHKTTVTEWDEEEQAEEERPITFPWFLGHLLLQLWPLVTLAFLMAGLAIWFDHHP